MIAEEIENLIPKKHVRQPDFGIGTRLWRPVSDSGIQNPVFDKDRQSYIIRATWGRGYIDNGWVALGTHDQGLVCFCKHEIPEQWTYFEVISVAENKKSAFVKPFVGSEAELLEQY